MRLPLPLNNLTGDRRWQLDWKTQRSFRSLLAKTTWQINEQNCCEVIKEGFSFSSIMNKLPWRTANSAVGLLGCFIFLLFLKSKMPGVP